MARAERRNRSLDARDADSLDTLLDSRGWQLTKDRLEHELSVQVADLEREHTELETAAIRGMIKGLRLAIGLPPMLYKEATKGKVTPE